MVRSHYVVRTIFKLSYYVRGLLNRAIALPIIPPMVLLPVLLLGLLPVLLVDLHLLLIRIMSVVMAAIIIHHHNRVMHAPSSRLTPLTTNLNMRKSKTTKMKMRNKIKTKMKIKTPLIQRIMSNALKAVLQPSYSDRALVYLCLESRSSIRRCHSVHVISYAVY